MKASWRSLLSFCIAASAFFLAACGGDAPGTTSGGSGPGNPATPTVSLVLVDAAGAAQSRLSPSQPLTAVATVRAAGAPVAGAIVNFAVADSTLATLSPTSGTVLTNADGTATITLAAGSQEGATSLSATTSIAGVEATASVNFNVVPATPTLSLVLVDGAGANQNRLSLNQPLFGVATVKVAGAPVAGAVVNFAVADATLATLSPASGSVLTGTDGTASISLRSTGVSGASTLAATTSVSGGQVAASINFSAASGQATTLVISSLTTTAPTQGISAYGSAGVSVTVRNSDGTVPTGAVTVTFSSSCPAGKATLTTSAVTQADGTAVGTFVDNGCAGVSPATVTISASIQSATRSTTLVVNPPTAGSLRFISSVPADRSITLRGQGGNQRQENATLTFRAVDLAGNGIADLDVCFDASTYVGGLNLDGFNNITLPPSQGSVALCGSDNVLRYVKRSDAAGNVVVQINSGTSPTPVRVRARALFPANSGNRLETISDSLSISTGLPVDRSMDLSIDRANIDGGNFSGETASITIRLADQFGNPVPDGTVVNFISSGGAVCTSQQGACATTNGVCSCTITSQDRRPPDGRVVVLAYTVGLEDFVDTNGNNQYDVGEPFTDLPDAFLDADKNGSFSTQAEIPATGDNDVPLAYQTPPNFRTSGDGVRGLAHLRRSTVVYFSRFSSVDPTIMIPRGAWSEDSFGNKFIALPQVPAPNCKDAALPSVVLSFVLDDGIGNPMAVETTLTVENPPNTIEASDLRPGSVAALGARTPSRARDFPNQPKTSTLFSRSDADPRLVFSGHSVRISSVPVDDACAGSASIQVFVKSPRGTEQSARVLFEGEARTTARFAIPVGHVALP